MKKNLFYLFVLAIAFASCKKDDTIVTPDSNTDASRAIGYNIHFTKKVLVEQFVGCSYGNVPYSDYILSNIDAANNHRVIVASMHINDQMQIPGNLPLANNFSNNNPITIPCSMIDRNGNIGSRLFSWQQYNGLIQQSLSQSAPCGLAISTKISNNRAMIDVSTKFGTNVSGGHIVSVYLVHENVHSTSSGYGQVSNFNTMPGNPFYGKGNPILPYDHRNVVCSMLTNVNAGKVNPSAQIRGGIDMQRFSCDYNPNQMGNDCYAIAYIYNSITKEVVNVQKVKMGLTKDWD